MSVFNGFPYNSLSPSLVHKSLSASLLKHLGKFHFAFLLFFFLPTASFFAFCWLQNMVQNVQEKVVECDCKGGVPTLQGDYLMAIGFYFLSNLFYW
jgi:hypothetical protein